MARSLDVRIVGGGFAGVVTALTLLNGRDAVDANVTVYERADAAHTTLCGEGLSDDTLRLFDAFDARPHIAQTFDESSWFFPRSGGATTEFRIHQRGHTMARESWIPAMADEVQRLGGTYRTGVKVDADGVRKMAREADVVIGCDGPGSVTRQVVGGDHTTMLGIQYRVAAEGRAPERLEFYTDKTYSPEYAWVFPRGDIQNVGLLATSDGQDWARLDRFMKDKHVTGKIIKREAYPIGFFGDRVQKDNIVLVGDAAGLTNPITKGGMAAVIHSAAMLVRAIKTDQLASYEAQLRAHPLMEPSFRPALDAIRAWTNDDFARLTRHAPPIVHVRPGVSTERTHWFALARTLLENVGKARDILTVSKAMGVSRQYSW